MQKLINSILTELKLQIFTEQDNDDKTIIAIYPGRFQPMGRHHKMAYDWLAKQFGEKNTFIVTSDKTEPQKSPLNFAEKKKVINKHGIKNVVKVRSPYLPTELIEKYDPNKTVLVYMIGEKDAGRLSGYKRLTKYNKTTKIPYKDIQNPYAYYVYAPHISLDIPSFGEMSGTNIRKSLGDREAKLAELKSRFKSIMGWFDPAIFNMIIAKMNTRRSKIKEHVDDWLRSFLNMSDIQAKMFFDILQKEYGDTKELLPIIRKFIKGKTISNSEREMFQQQMKDTIKLLGLGAIAAIPIPGTMLLIPVIVQLAKKFNVNLLPETKEREGERLSIVRREFWDKVFEEVLKEDYVVCEECGEQMKQIQYRHLKYKHNMTLNEYVQKYPNSKIVSESAKNYGQKNPVDSRQLLVCGGVAGHMTHPFEDMGLTFGDMKEMFRLGLSGEITTTGAPSEKLDGQNLFVSFKGGKLYAARNKGDIKNGGMDYTSIKTKFAGRGEIERAFTYAFRDLEQAIQKLSPKQQEKIFKGGTAWMNLEVMYPESANVINYDGAYIVFHGVSLYNNVGEKVEEYPQYASILAGMIKQVNADTQKTFSIAKPKRLTIGKSKNFEQKLQYFVNELTKLQNKMNCKDSDTLGVWHQRWWEKYIKTNAKRLDVYVDEKTMEGLVKRWGFYDKSFSLNSVNIPDPEFLNWAKEVDKTKLQEQQKKNIRPFEQLVLKFGSEVLTNVSDVMALNPTKTTQKIRKDVEDAIRILSKSTDINDLKVLNTQLSRIKSAGGIDSIVPLEGIVFTFNGKTYKLTGVFAPINQLLGYFKFK